MSKKRKHIFAICAYGESPYLEECIQSVLHQSVPSHVILATATPNDHIRGLSEKYNIPLYINTGDHGITQDWNFAYRMADAEYVTITHQDDRYHADYLKNLFAYLKKAENPLIFFTDYGEIRNGEIVEKNTLLQVKRAMLFPLRPAAHWKNRWLRRRILSLGSPICCPSVTFVKENLPEEIFVHHFRSDEDWEAWERLSRLEGSFVFCNTILTYHRIHEDSETSKILQDNHRGEEDLEMFRKFWPDPIARFWAKLYSASEKSNNL